jgi:membrane-bound lytic murein transglycosylase B
MHNSKSLRAMLCAAVAVLLSPGISQAASCGNNGQGFGNFIKAFHKDAADQGIGNVALAVLDATTYDAGIIKKDRAQNVFSQSFLQFSGRMATDYRIKHGAELIQKNKATFAAVEKQFGVPAPVIVAFWALKRTLAPTLEICQPYNHLQRLPGIAGGQKNSARN